MSQRAVVSTLFELAGMAAIVTGVAMLSVAAAFIIGGVGGMLIGFSVAAGDR